MSAIQTAAAGRAAIPATTTELTLFIGPPAASDQLAELCADVRRREGWGDTRPAREFAAFREGLVRTLLEEVDGARAPIRELLERIIGEPIGTLHADVRQGVLRGERCPALAIDLNDSTLATGVPLLTHLGERQIQALTSALGVAFGAEWVEVAGT
jgi:hypothetical protein